MLDFSFSELLLCFLVALVVLGPERMPGVARGIGRWTGKARSYVRNLSAELERESQVAEFKRQVSDAQRILREESSALQQSVQSNVNTLEAQARESAVQDSLAAPSPNTPAHTPASTTPAGGATAEPPKPAAH